VALPKIIVDAPSDAIHPLPEGMLDAIHQGDCVEHLRSLPEGCVQLVFADPPFNIGYEYDVYDDRLEHEKYLDWCRQWIAEIHRILIPTGTFWLAIGDEYAAELKLLSQELGFHCRSWVVWYYTFGVHCRSKFTRSHAHLFYFVKDPKRFTFHAKEIAVPSARQLVYADARANPSGRTPDDTWILRPQDCTEGLTPNEDTWYFPRVNGTFKERAGFHGCQMPEQLLGRILRACSNVGDVVLDPFSGSATTVATAKKLARHYVGFDLSPEYVELGTQRLGRILPGEPLEGAADPKSSAPATKDGKQRNAADDHRPATRRSPSRRVESSHTPLLPFLNEVVPDEQPWVEAFQATHRGSSVDRLILDPILNEDFQHACEQRGLAGTTADRNRFLLQLRKRGLLQDIDRSKEQIVAPKWSEIDRYAHASEIAWRRVGDLYQVGLEELFCDPRTAAAFDHIAAEHAPGHLPLEYRWGALMIRDAIRSSQHAVESMPELGSEWMEWERATVIEGNSPSWEEVPEAEAVYAFERSDTGGLIFLGETLQLRNRLRVQWGHAAIARASGLQPEQTRLRYLLLPSPNPLPWVRRTRLLAKQPSEWNVVHV
jgi:DNA modification methylase